MPENKLNEEKKDTNEVDINECTNNNANSNTNTEET